MDDSIEKLLKVQAVDSQVIFLKQSAQMRPRELDGDRRKVVEARATLEVINDHMKRLKVGSAARELDVRKADTEIEKLKIALNQAKSNSEYTIYKEQIKKQEEARGKVEEEVLQMLTDLDTLEAKRKEAQAELDAGEKVLKKKEAELADLLKGIQEQIAGLESQRGALLEGIDPEKLGIYERVLARHNNFAIARVEGQVCHGCYMSVTTQEITHLKLGQFIQCKSCLRILYLP